MRTLPTKRCPGAKESMKIKAWALLLKIYLKVIRKLRLFCSAFFFRAFVNYSLCQYSGQDISQFLARDFV